jgi:transcriptional regulator GlxA family with amidase domain
MHANLHQDSIAALNVLDCRQAHEPRLNKRISLRLAWRAPQWWPVPVHHRARETASGRLLVSKPPLDQVSVDPPLVMLAKHYIQDHYRENLSLEQVADALCTEAFPLGQLVRQTTGMDFADYLTRAR